MKDHDGLIYHFFDRLWDCFERNAPQAAAIRDRLGPNVKNDHVAFRLFGAGAMCIDYFEKEILDIGFQVQEDYKFDDKHLFARSYIHSKEGVPKIFISELVLDDFPKWFKKEIEAIAPKEMPELTFESGVTWDPISTDLYEKIKAESEYTSWLIANGVVPNHFTVDVNSLEGYNSLEEVLDAVESWGYQIHTPRVQGSEELLLRQGSTVAERHLRPFSNAAIMVPTCFYEFAYRYPDKDGKLFQGFRTENANKIFESTNVLRA